jgi:hypothetical protein
MPLIIPNAFVAGTVIDATKVEANNEAIKKYLNGGNVTYASAPAFSQNNIMNGEYIFDNMDFDGTSGHEIGAQELPVMLVGALPKYWSTSTGSPKTIPRTGTTFYMKAQGDILVRFEMAVRGFESETVAPFSSSVASIWIALDGANFAATKFVFAEENDWGTGAVGGVIPSWEKRRTYNGCYLLQSIPPGEHTIELVGNSNAQAFFLRNLSFTIEQHYS